jgi:hypothetical protein
MFCPHCGVGIHLTDVCCLECGRPLNERPHPAEWALGLTLLSIYSGFSGVLILLMTLPLSLLASAATLPVFPPFERTAWPVLSAILALLGVLNLALAVGLWTRQRWAHPLAVGLYIAGPSLGLFLLCGGPHGSFQTFTTFTECLIAGAALVYLFSPATRAQFTMAD